MNQKHQIISCECKSKFDRIKKNSNQWWNNDKRWYKCKNIKYVKMILFGIVFGNCQNGKYFASIMDDPMIICDEVFESCIEKLKTIPKNFNEKKLNAVFFVLLAFLLITIALLIPVVFTVIW